MKTFYKAVPMRFLDGIKRTGLDPALAGQSGGATAMSRGVRPPTALDTNYTWLFQSKESAIGYAQDKFVNREPVLLKIKLDDDFPINNHNTSGFGTAHLIPTSSIWFQTDKGHHWEPMVKYSKHLAFIYEEDLSVDSSSDED